MAGKGFVLHLIRPERHIADGKVKEIPAVSRFKACNGDVRLGIQLLGGDHEEIRKWRLARAFERTLEKRPELLELLKGEEPLDRRDET